MYVNKRCFPDITSEERMVFRLKKSIDSFLKYAEEMAKDSSVEVKHDYLLHDMKVKDF